MIREGYCSTLAGPCGVSFPQGKGAGRRRPDHWRFHWPNRSAGFKPPGNGSIGPQGDAPARGDTPVGRTRGRQNPGGGAADKSLRVGDTGCELSGGGYGAPSSARRWVVRGGERGGKAIRALPAGPLT